MKSKKMNQQKIIKNHTVGPQVVRPPGNLSYNGIYKDEPTRIDILAYDSAGFTLNTYHSVSELPTHLPEDKSLWIDINGLNDPGVISEMGRRFGIHVMHQEDIVSIDSHSKINITDRYTMTVHNRIFLRDGTIRREQVSIVLLDKAVLIFQEYFDDTFLEVRRRILNHESRIINLGSDFLYYSLVDKIVDDTTYALKSITYALDEMEISITEGAAVDTKRLYQQRRDLLKIRSAVTPLDNFVHLLISKEHNILTEQVVPYMEDVGQNVDQLITDIYRNREIIENLQTEKEARGNSELNKTIKVLTVLSTAFLPLNFITGVYGMNFLHLPLLDHPQPLVLFVAVVIATEALLFWFLKHNKIL